MAKAAKLVELEKDNTNLKNVEKKNKEDLELLETQLNEQKGAYEVLLDTIREKESSYETLEEQKQELEA